MEILLTGLFALAFLAAGYWALKKYSTQKPTTILLWAAIIMGLAATYAIMGANRGAPPDTPPAEVHDGPAD